MDHAVRIPEMGVSKVPLSSCVILIICVQYESLTHLTIKCVCSSSMQKFTLTRSSRATCWWTREARMGRSSMAKGSYRFPFPLSYLTNRFKARIQQSWFIPYSLKPNVSHMRWCTVTRWRWEKLFCPSTSTRGLTPVMAVSRVRWWLISASTRQRRSQVRHRSGQRPNMRSHW